MKKRRFFADILKKMMFSVGLKINTILAVMFVFFIVFTLINQNILETYSTSYTQQVSRLYAVQRIKNLFKENNRTINEYLRTGNRSQLAQYNEIYFTAKNEISALYTSIQYNEISYLMRSIQKSYDIYFSECSGASFLYNTSNYNYYSRMYYAEKIQTYLQKYCDELLDYLLRDSIEKNRQLLIKQEALNFFNIAFMIVLLSIFASFMMYVTVSLTRPLEHLVLQASAVSQGNFDVQVPVRNPDNSVGVLSAAFNKMVRDLHDMVKNIQEKVETEKKLLAEQRKNLEYHKLLNQANFMALQTQTNPHFLFNTLNSISRTISLGKEEQSLQMIDSLANLLRYSLSDGSAPVLLGTEIEATMEYLAIQKHRFGSRISYRTDIRDNADSRVELPKFTLQPLVENAIIHGIEPKEDGGKIIISAKMRASRCVIRIFDNGTGISPQKLAELNSSTKNIVSRRIGIHNTKKRLELSAHTRSPFKVLSKEGKWTMIVITLKAEPEVKKNVHASNRR